MSINQPIRASIEVKTIQELQEVLETLKNKKQDTVNENWEEPFLYCVGRF